MASATKPDDAARPAKPRLAALDGMRGLAAMVVFAHHALALLAGPLAGIRPQSHAAGLHGAAAALHTLPVGWMFNGAFAVSFFFVLSGFVLTLAAGRQPGPERMARLISTRLLRLLPLVVLGTLGGFAVFNLSVRGLNMLGPLAGDNSADYIAASLLQHHSFADALRQMASRIWGGAEAATLFDPPLWSIGVELQGSLLVFMLATVFAKTSRRATRYQVGVPIGLCLMGTSSLCFLMGMFLAERLQEDGVVFPGSALSLKVLAAAALVWASVHPWDPNLWLPLPFAPHETLRTLLDTAAASVLLICGLQLAGLQRLLNSAPVQRLGEASYGLYVIHAPLLYVAAAPLTKLFLPRVMSYDLAAWMAAGVLFVISCVAGWLLVRYVDAPLAQLSKRSVTHWLAG